MKHINSRDNPLARRVRSISHSSRERKKLGLALIEGPHLVTALIDSGSQPESLIASESGMRHPEIVRLMQSAAAEHVVFSDAIFHEMSSVETPVGLLALVKPPVPLPVPADSSFCLLLEDIQDPGNLGSLLRSAAAAGVRDVLLSRTCAFAWSPKVLRAGQGAHFCLNIVEGADLEAFVRTFSGDSIALTPAARPSLFGLKLSGAIALLIGNEGAGLTSALMTAAKYRAKLPMPGGFESLNAAAAGAIAMFEVVRQRSTGNR